MDGAWLQVYINFLFVLLPRMANTPLRLLPQQPALLMHQVRFLHPSLLMSVKMGIKIYYSGHVLCRRFIIYMWWTVAWMVCYVLF